MDTTCTAEKHGDLNAYNHYACRCPDARLASMRREKRRLLHLQRTGQPLWIDATGTRRRLQALTAIGWTTWTLADHLGSYQSAVRRLLRWEGRVHHNTATRVAALYDELSMTPGVSPRADRTRRWAAGNGWAPPLAWDDIDNPGETPRGMDNQERAHRKTDPDPIVIDQLCAGTHTGKPTRAERLEAVKRMHEAGLSAPLIAQRIRRHTRQVTRDLADLRADEQQEVA